MRTPKTIFWGINIVTRLKGSGVEIILNDNPAFLTLLNILDNNISFVQYIQFNSKLCGFLRSKPLH